MKNRIEKFFPDSESGSESKDVKILFEKFDPIAIQRALNGDQEDQGEFDYSEDDEDETPIPKMKFWIGHCNFNITKKIFEEMQKIEGVEALNILTRYRFRLGVGKLFDDAEVKRRVIAVLNKYQPNAGKPEQDS